MHEVADGDTLSVGSIGSISSKLSGAFTDLEEAGVCNFGGAPGSTNSSTNIKEKMNSALTPPQQDLTFSFSRNSSYKSGIR